MNRSQGNCSNWSCYFSTGRHK